MDGTGPLGQGQASGRKIGKCNFLNDDEKIKQMGIGMGKRRKATIEEIIKH